jgi:hypothetical protein
MSQVFAASKMAMIVGSSSLADCASIARVATSSVAPKRQESGIGTVA